jgi:hypothetical protein
VIGSVIITGASVVIVDASNVVITGSVVKIIGCLVVSCIMLGLNAFITQLLNSYKNANIFLLQYGLPKVPSRQTQIYSI